MVAITLTTRKLSEDSPAKMAQEAKSAGYTFPYLYDESQAWQGFSGRLHAGHLSF